MCTGACCIHVGFEQGYIIIVLRFVVVYKTNKLKMNLKMLSIVIQINNNAITIVRYGVEKCSSAVKEMTISDKFIAQYCS